jgi:hypothetical protein
MNHPKKNKTRNPTLPEDQQIDERNLIDVELADEISIEDRISLYWMENKSFIIGCITVLALAIVGMNGLRLYKDFATEALQAEYTSAKAEATLSEFARAHSNKDLGGLAALTTADELFSDKDYSQALEFYGIAAAALQDNILAGRATLGQAFSLYYNAQAAEGLALLNSITADNKLAESARAEAAYHLAIEADIAGRSEEFDSYAAQINAMELAGQWQQRLSYYQQQPR